jgi:hypothetical protein
VTYHVVIAFDRDAEGDLKPGEAREVLSPIIAERRARALAVGHVGALAFPAPAILRRASFRTRWSWPSLARLISIGSVNDRPATTNGGVAAANH